MTKFRESTSSLGMVIQQAMQTGDAHWVVTANMWSGGGPSPSAVVRREAPNSHFRASALYQRQGACAKGAHGCAVVTKKPESVVPQVMVPARAGSQ